MSMGDTSGEDRHVLKFTRMPLSMSMSMSMSGLVPVLMSGAWKTGSERYIRMRPCRRRGVAMSGADHDHIVVTS